MISKILLEYLPESAYFTKDAFFGEIPLAVLTDVGRSPGHGLIVGVQWAVPKLLPGAVAVEPEVERDYPARDGIEAAVDRDQRLHQPEQGLKEHRGP